MPAFDSETTSDTNVYKNAFQYGVEPKTDVYKNTGSDDHVYKNAGSDHVYKSAGGGSEPAAPAPLALRPGEGKYAQTDGHWEHQGVVEAEDFDHMAKLGAEYKGEDHEAKFRGGNQKNADGSTTQVTTSYLKTDEERARYGVSADAQGRLQGAGGTPLDTTGASGQLNDAAQDRMIFAMNAQGKTLAADSKKETKISDQEQSFFHHSSMFAGKDVASAGEIGTNSEGWVKDVSNRSGHYRPDAQNLLQGVEGLDRMGANLDAAHVDVVGGGQHSALGFLESQGNTETLGKRAGVMSEIGALGGAGSDGWRAKAKHVETRESGPLDYAEQFAA